MAYLDSNKLYKCTICKIDKPCTKEYFYKAKNYKGKERLHEKCKICWRAEFKENNTTPEKRLKYRLTKLKYSKGTGKYKSLLKGYKQNDIKANRDNDLDEIWLKQTIENAKCIYCELPEEDQMGLDRIDNSMGHIKTNCVPCCRVCNVVRGNIFTIEEMKLIGKTIKQIKETRKVLKTYNRSEYEQINTSGILQEILQIS